MNIKLVVTLVSVLSISFLALIGCAQKTSPGSVTPAQSPAGTGPATGNLGKQLFFDKGCITCHRINGEGGDVGPSLVGISGRTVELTTGEKVNRTHDYLHESVIDPDAKVVKGYQAGMMPKTSVTADQLHELSEFIEGLK